ncbi:DUF5060 domain-containing protein [Namhaeicola litoreus]|uniref:DUF5060 domain-containing protein n=1 Tax=Namhaeicola litoreus TaxID=1052145 RepID=A0ABW3Y573_9FLAO
MTFSRLSFFLLSSVFMLTISCQRSEVQIQGELKKWHKIELVFEGPKTNEMDEVNPFLDYRLDVVFKSNNKEYVVPGFYAADGNAAETSSDAGNVWKVRFTPDEIGEWNYTVSFKKGDEVAVSQDISKATSGGFMDGQKGVFTVLESDKSGRDNRAKGRLNYIGGHYLQFEETGKYFIKLGVDAPENLLAYADFDGATNALDFQKTWEPHQKDFAEDAKSFVWQNNKGENLLGAIHYLASEELNAFSFLTFNVDGDDRNVFPHLLKVPVSEYEAYANDKKNKEAWENMFHKTRYDVSKLDQWERIFDYAETQGMFLHFKTNETETDHLMDKGDFGVEGKLYYRELIARFGHHLVMNWNIGEENDDPIRKVVEVANYIKTLDPYKHHLVIHTFPNKDDRYADLIGDQSPLTGASLQLSRENFSDVHPRVLKWRTKSDSTGVKWAIAVDEPGSAKIALLPDNEDLTHDFARGNAMWGTLMAGGFGVEWYFGYASPNSDLTCQDFRSRDLFWDQNRYALHFFDNYIPFWEMASADDLLIDSNGFCFAKKGEVYVVYLQPDQKTANILLEESEKLFEVQWFDPRNGKFLESASQELATSYGLLSIAKPSESEDKDWVALIKKSE